MREFIFAVFADFKSNPKNKSSQKIRQKIFPGTKQYPIFLRLKSLFCTGNTTQLEPA